MTDATEKPAGQTPDPDSDEAWGFDNTPPPDVAAAHPPLGSAPLNTTGLRPISAGIAAALEQCGPPVAVVPATLPPRESQLLMNEEPLRRQTIEGLGMEQPGAPERLDTVPAGGTVSINGEPGNALLTIRPTELVPGTQLGYQEFAAAASQPTAEGNQEVDLTAVTLPLSPRVPSLDHRTAYRPPPMPRALAGDDTDHEVDLSRLVAMVPRGVIRDHTAQEPPRVADTPSPELTPPPSVELFPELAAASGDMFDIPGASATNDRSSATPVDAAAGNFFLDDLDRGQADLPEQGFHESGSSPINPDGSKPPTGDDELLAEVGDLAFALAYLTLSSRLPTAGPPPAATDDGPSRAPTPAPPVEEPLPSVLPPEPPTYATQVSVPPLANFVVDPPTNEETVTAQRDVPTLILPSPPHPWWRFRWTHRGWWTIRKMMVAVMITGFISLAVVLIQRYLEWYYGV